MEKVPGSDKSCGYNETRLAEKKLTIIYKLRYLDSSGHRDILAVA